MRQPTGLLRKLPAFPVSHQTSRHLRTELSQHTDTYRHTPPGEGKPPSAPLPHHQRALVTPASRLVAGEATGLVSRVRFEGEIIKEERGVVGADIRQWVISLLSDGPRVLEGCQLDLEGISNLLKVDLLAGQVLVVRCALGIRAGRTCGGSEVVAEGDELPGHAVRRGR